jgi:hypothetical protein
MGERINIKVDGISYKPIRASATYKPLPTVLN